MIWERDPLLAKARLFFQRAFDEPRDAPTFGLWCSLGLELLARAALASISPTLLAEPDRDHKYLLHALNRGSVSTPRKSITVTQVFALCHTLVRDFSKEDCTIALALINRRNEELHSGGAGFAEYPASQWLAGFYRACRTLCVAMGESLTSLFGEDEADVANEALTEDAKDVRQRVQSAIASHRSVFLDKSKEEREVAASRAAELGAQLATRRHHCVPCPACACIAAVHGRAFGPEHVTHVEGEIVVRQAVAPTGFACSACDLKLEGYAALEAAGLGGHYQRQTTYSPDEYFGLIAPEDLDSHIQAYLENMREYDNED
jgi:hypothetical protein